MTKQESNNVTTTSDITAQAIRFIERMTYADLPEEALAIGRRCMVDTVGLYLAGSHEASVRILIEDALAQGGRGDALVFPAFHEGRHPGSLLGAEARVAREHDDQLDALARVLALPAGARGVHAVHVRDAQVSLKKVNAEVAGGARPRSR